MDHYNFHLLIYLNRIACKRIPFTLCCKNAVHRKIFYYITTFCTLTEIQYSGGYFNVKSPYVY